MSLWSRIANVFRGEALNRDIQEELESHIAEAIERGREPAEAMRAFGSVLRQGETSRDLRLLAWLDSLRADLVFGWRQLNKRKVTSGAAILSLALAIGACTSAFRLIDALLLRPLPISDPGRLYVFAQEGMDSSGHFRISESSEYPIFRMLRAAAKDQAELIAISSPSRIDLTYGSDDQMEKANRQYVSGWMFDSFGLRPALGRLLRENDDVKPRAHPYAVLSYDYWSRRFGNDRSVVGRTFHNGSDVYQIVGVAPRYFTGTETGTVIDIFVPTMMNPLVTHTDASWFRPFVKLKPGVTPESVRDRLHPVYQAFLEDRAKGFVNMSQARKDAFLHQRVLMEPAGSGISWMQREYRAALLSLGVLVCLVLLIACANVANLMMAQAAARAREMALRVSIGAGRSRLVQLVLVESAIVAFLAAGIGWWFAWWSAPFVLSRISSPDNPARLFLPADWRVLGFALALTLAVTVLFGLAPALRASAVKPAAALKGSGDAHSRGRLMHVLIGAQVAFCFVVLFVAGLFVTTSNRLSHLATGFCSDRLLVLDTVTQRAQPPVIWDQVTEHLRDLPGVEAAGLSYWALLSGNGSNGYIWINGAPAGDTLSYFLGVSPGWIGAMKIPLLNGRDLRRDDAYPGSVLVNQAFAREYFHGQNPVGQWIERSFGGARRYRIQVVGLVGDARYRNMREPITPTVYVPFTSVDNKGVPIPQGSGTFVVRTSSANPVALAGMLREEVSRARSEFRVSNIATQEELIQQHTVRERLLAMLAQFFALVALMLGGIGLYGVLDYSVLQRRRELGIRIAVGAPATDIARRVTADIFSMVLAGALAGVGLGMTSAQYIETLLFQVKGTDAAILAVPSVMIVVVALLAALPAVIRAVRIDPVTMLRCE